MEGCISDPDDDDSDSEAEAEDREAASRIHFEMLLSVLINAPSNALVLLSVHAINIYKLPRKGILRNEPSVFLIETAQHFE